ncbi:MAG: DUF559 domain-containing protein [Candidatus Scalindua sp. AMX11]|nr:MAG: DUF559 domain-containing protein [Candidatus Scalindua sp.]NOG82251.1 DUF559 domain-containing protein [Planctomycetota bacterium]RZV71475.1 MAG: DUF559 domain-containing protein [Candidatus Scalindua sp. SCAELEC01]TDE64306.1 MAG: DUF559 domain-containing protein [Candidatus Scalindua sp. AMX11]
MPRNTLIPYNPKLKIFARELRKNSTLSEVLLWKQLKGKVLGYEFHRQVPLDEFIVDFYCHELMLAIEIDGCSHDERYDYDMTRQTKLQDLGVSFVRFHDLDVKKKMADVLPALKKQIKDIEKNIPRVLPGDKTVPLQRGT